MTALAGELTVRQLGEMLRERDLGVRVHFSGDEAVWWAQVGVEWASAPDLQDALMLAVSRIDEVRGG